MDHRRLLEGLHCPRGSFINTSANDLCDWQFGQWSLSQFSWMGSGQDRAPVTRKVPPVLPPKAQKDDMVMLLSMRKENSVEKAGECHWLHSTSVTSQDNLF